MTGEPITVVAAHPRAGTLVIQIRPTEARTTEVAVFRKHHGTFRPVEVTAGSHGRWTADDHQLLSLQTDVGPIELEIINGIPDGILSWHNTLIEVLKSGYDVTYAADGTIVDVVVAVTSR